jgi:RNA polymerase sigma factor (sigma-70 family)
MLWHPHDAEDATQEILVKLLTRLSTFRGDALFSTWAYRVAVNHLLSTRRRRAEQPAMSFEAFAEDPQAASTSPTTPGTSTRVCLPRR